MANSWLRKIGRLKRLINDVDGLWPEPSTRLAGYAETGPYHCEDCVYLKGRKQGEDKIFRDSEGKGRCSHPIMMADSEVKKDNKFLSIVNIERGCCEFVDNKGLEDSEHEANESPEFEAGEREGAAETKIGLS